METNGLDWKRNATCGFVIGIGPTREDCYYFPIRHASGNRLDRVIEWVRSWASDPTLTIVGHHLKFDLHFAENDGIQFAGKVICTMVNAALINENMDSYALGAVAKAYRLAFIKKDEELYKAMAEQFGGKPDRKQMEHFHKMPGDHPLIEEYAKADALATWHVYHTQLEEIEKQNLATVVGVESRVLRTLQNMERRGVPVDEKQAAKVRSEMGVLYDRAMSEMPPGINIRSPRQLQKWFEEVGVSGWPTTEKNNASFPEEWLITHERGKLVVAARKSSNIINSFLDPLINEHVYKGRVHTTFNQLRQDEYGTVTGRLSSNDPNMQQVPKRDKVLAPLFRSIFVAGKGFTWSANDYSQQEFRVFADYSQSPMLLEGYRANPPVDIHTQVAELLGVDRDPTAKRLNLGILYGMGVEKLAKSLGIPNLKAEGYRNQWRAVIPEAQRFLKSAAYYAQKRGWVRTKLGRRRRFPDPNLAHKAGNSVIQGTSADITKLKMVEIDEFFLSQGARSHLILQVHDELDWLVADGEEELDRQAREIMQTFDEACLIQMSVPMGVESNHGRNWGAATFDKGRKDVRSVQKTSSDARRAV